MIDKAALENLIRDNSETKFMVHNGFFAWSYGSPQDPLVISLDTVVQILNQFEIDTGKDPLFEFQRNPLGLVYAEFNDDLYLKTGSNRILGLYKIHECVYTLEYNKELEHEFRI